MPNNKNNAKIVFSTTFAGGADKSESAPATRLEPSTAETLQGLHPQCEYWAKGVDREKLPRTIFTVTWGERRGRTDLRLSRRLEAPISSSGTHRPRQARVAGTSLPSGSKTAADQLPRPLVRFGQRFHLLVGVKNSSVRSEETKT